MNAGAAHIVDDADFTRGYVTHSLVPLLGDRAAIDKMAAAADGVGTRRGTENVMAHLDRALKENRR